MSKLDQLKALSEAKRVARNSSDGGVGSRNIPARALGANAAKLAGVAPSPSEAKRGRGRPKVEGPRPWEVAGVSRATWHRRRQKEQKND